MPKGELKKLFIVGNNGWFAFASLCLALRALINFPTLLQQVNSGRRAGGVQAGLKPITFCYFSQRYAVSMYVLVSE